jgi:8-oxo-dGTP diphosphatase
LIHRFPGVFKGQEIELILDGAYSDVSCSALIFAFFQRKLLFTHHRKRGWELPGGKRLENEMIIQTALRELYEETGAEVSAIEVIGQYSIYTNGVREIVKTVFIANVSKIHDLPNCDETDEIKLYIYPPNKHEIKTDGFSPLVQDGVYTTILQVINSHPFLCRHSSLNLIGG